MMAVVQRILGLLPLIAASALAAVPDRAPLPEEWGYRPAEGAAVAVNPPSITWVHERDAASYDLEWSRRADFSRAETARGLPWSVYTHDRALAPGTYYWRYRIAGSGVEPNSQLPHPRRSG